MLRPPSCCYGVFGVVTELMYLLVTTDRHLFAKLHVVVFIRLNTLKLRPDVRMSAVLSLE